MCVCNQGVCEEKYDVKICVEDAAVIVTSDKDPATSCTITLTSPIMREENASDAGTSLGAPLTILSSQRHQEFIPSHPTTSLVEEQTYNYLLLLIFCPV